MNINGFGCIIKAFENHLLQNGGVLVGISSVWSMTPPLSLPWVSYPATKVYLDMAMRCLRIFWKDKVKVMTVHIGHVDNFGTSNLPRWLTPTYTIAAKKISKALSKNRIPRDVYCPLLYRIFYNYFFRFVPDSILSRISIFFYQFAKKMERRI